LPLLHIILFLYITEKTIMEKRMKFTKGLTGLVSVSALTVGMGMASTTAFAAVPLFPASATNNFHVGAQVTSAVANYNAALGGNGDNGSGIAAAGPFAPASSVNITWSRHNLGTTNKIESNHTTNLFDGNPSGNNVAVVGTNQICVFCHTPHGFNPVPSGPLWNKRVSASTVYTVYNAGSNSSSTLDADIPQIGSVSLACLSCHDGTQAMDSMINGPGSGGMMGGGSGYDASLSSTAQASMSLLGASQGYVWGDSAGGFAMMSQGGSDAAALGFTDLNGAAVNGDNPASEGILLGTDLSNDHPISVQYCGGGISSTTQISAVAGSAGVIAAGTCRDRLFNLPTVQVLNGTNRFWVDTAIVADTDAIAAGAASTGGTSGDPVTRNPDTVETYVTAGLDLASANPLAGSQTGDCGNGNNGDACGRGFVAATGPNDATKTVSGFGIRTKQDIMLFTNNPGVTGPSVECASCHDPHTPNNGTFLRVSNSGSGLCLSCHVK
jgi:predicted CXXCH cytochrome family protein